MEHIRVVEEGPVASVVLNRPERRNALSLAMMNEVIEALRGLREHAEVVVIRGEGPSFSSGHDLGEMVDREPSFYADLFDTCTRMMEMIHETPQPVIARVHGMATAAGCQLVAACDLVVASEDARFATPGVKIGLFCSTPMVPISRAVGRKRAMEMLLTGEPIDAETAARWGLVNRVVSPSDLDDEVNSLARQIASHSTRVNAIGKRAFYAQIELDEPEAYDLTTEVMASNAALPDAREGITAFLEKRTPRWPPA